MKELIKKFRIHQLGAFSYLIWGIYYIFIAKEVQNLAIIVSEETIKSHVYQNAFLVSGLALAVIAIALIYNLRNKKIGWALNAVIAGFVELSILATTLTNLGFLVSLPGLLIYITGLILTSLGLFYNKQTK